jgi:hypothetical protein
VLAGSLIVASLSAWRRGSDLREAQAQAAILVDTLSRDVRNASQAPSVVLHPPVPADEGEGLLAVTGPATESGGGATWIAYVYRPDRREVVRQRLVVRDGTLTVLEARLVTTGVERITVVPAGSGVTVEVEVRRGRSIASARSTAVPRNP